MMSFKIPQEWAPLEQEAIRAWSELFKVTRQPVREVVSQLVRDGAEVLADEFYQRMMADPRATRFLDQERVQTRLRGSMRRWMVELFGTLIEDEISGSIRRQIEVGVVHARIRLPIDLISAGIRVLKRGIRRRIDFAPLDQSDRLVALIYVSDLLHLADSLMNLGYLRNTQDVVRNDEAYRLVAQRKSSTVELTRQRAALSEWAEALLLSVWDTTGGTTPAPLRETTFGIWIHHKGPVLFGQSDEFKELRDSIDIMDQQLLPRLRASMGDRERLESTIGTFRKLLDMIRFRMNELFAGIALRDEGLDTETQLPDRQYLPAILSRTMQSHLESGRPCSLLLIQIGIPDASEHLRSGLRARLMHTGAHVLSACVRTTDHVFRFADCQFMVVAIETSLQAANQLAGQITEQLRHTLQSVYVNGSITPASPTVQIGVCEYDRHPDYQYFIQRCVEALATSELRSRGRRAAGESNMRPMSTREQRPH
jgi:diguanylate cyclase